SSHRNSRCIGNTSLHFDEAQLTRAGYSRFNVIATLVGAHIPGFKTQSCFGLHHHFHSEKLDLLAVLCGRSLVCRSPIWLQFPEQSNRNDKRTAYYYGRQWRELSFEFQFGHTFLQTGLQLIGPLTGLAGIDLGIGLTREFLVLELIGAVVPVVDFLRESVLNRLSP